MQQRSARIPGRSTSPRPSPWTCARPLPVELRLPAPSLFWFALTPGRLEEEIGRVAEKQPGEQHPGDQDRVAEAAVDVEELLDDEQDRAGRDGEERHRDRVVDPGL